MIKLICTLAPLWLVGILPLLGGCAGIPKSGGPLTHHVTISVDEAKCQAASRWVWLTLGGDIAESECEALVAGQRARQILRLIEAGWRPPQQ